MKKIYIHYNYDFNGSVAFAAVDTKNKNNNIIYNRDSDFICSKCGHKLLPFYNYCPKCGNISRFGSALYLLTDGEAFCEQVDYDSIEKDVKQIICGNNDISLEKCKVIAKTYIQEEMNSQKNYIYHVIADVIENGNPERYGVLLFNPRKEENAEKYDELSCMVKCTGYDDDHIEKSFNKILKECFDES